MAMMFDIIFKTFSNMFYPTQTQIHLEIECQEKAVEHAGGQRQQMQKKLDQYLAEKESE